MASWEWAKVVLLGVIVVGCLLDIIIDSKLGPSEYSKRMG